MAPSMPNGGAFNCGTAKRMRSQSGQQQFVNGSSRTTIDFREQRIRRNGLRAMFTIVAMDVPRLWLCAPPESARHRRRDMNGFFFWRATEGPLNWSHCVVWTISLAGWTNWIVPETGDWRSTAFYLYLGMLRQFAFEWSDDNDPTRWLYVWLTEEVPKFLVWIENGAAGRESFWFLLLFAGAMWKVRYAEGEKQRGGQKRRWRFLLPR